MIDGIIINKDILRQTYILFDMILGWNDESDLILNIDNISNLFRTGEILHEPIEEGIDRYIYHGGRVCSNIFFK